MTFHDWDLRLLVGLGLTATAERRRFLVAWQACEGSAAAFNPLNTTMKLPGSTRFNSAGVQNYQDEIAGLAATLLTLRLPFYKGLRGALADHGDDARAIAVHSAGSLITWGTGTRCIFQKLHVS